jgi:hypothetical protein
MRYPEGLGTKMPRKYLGRYIWYGTIHISLTAEEYILWSTYSTVPILY